MNIFVTDSHPRKAAQALDDKRLQKMFVESVQMLSNAIHQLCRPDKDKVDLLPRTVDGMPYLKAHFNHPCSVWVRESSANYEWLLVHAISLYEEHRARKGTSRNFPIHRLNISKLEDALRWMVFPNVETQPFRNCSPYKHLPIVEAYRRNMMEKWVFSDVRRPRWTNSAPPEWLKPTYFHCRATIHYMDKEKWPIDILGL